MSLRRKHREAEVSTDSLNDIMFFLLLFFLILSTMVSPNSIKVNLASSTPRKDFVDNHEVTISNMESVIADKIKGKADPVLVMHLDKDLSIQDEVDILQI